MTRYTVQFGTCISSDGTEEKLYVTQPDLYLDEFNKQKASFKNPDVTDESIRKIAEKVVNSRIACKLGEYEDIDTDPRQLAKAKQALEIIKKYKWEINLNWLRFCVFANEEYEFYIESCKQDKHKYITKEEYDLLKEVLL